MTEAFGTGTGAPAPAPGGLDWLIRAFIEETAGVRDAAVVSADGVLLAYDGTSGAARAGHLAAVTSGIAALAAGGSEVLGTGAVHRTLVEMNDSFLLVSRLADSALLAVYADPGCDLSLLAYQSARLARRAGAALAPAPRSPADAAAMRTAGGHP
ncbi:roadblock/LC7 domain-containing protein [Streptomyces vinaceus]|uniref:roadblock/LC7 domain-containing protein n=1 Tax=Streptomyces vinaceus TaxID=1960 RepID=UPI0037FA8998